MNCMQEWSDRVTNEQIQCILEIGELLYILPHHERPLRFTLMAAQLADNGVARSVEEANIMLMEAYAHASNMQLIKWYDDMVLKMGTKDLTN